MYGIIKRIKNLLYNLKNLPDLNRDIDMIKSRYELGEDLFLEFQNEKNSKKYLEVYEKESPLVSCIIATYNRGKLLINRSLKSVLNQTYKNLEIIVIGDNCTDETEDLIKEINDNRLKFINLPERGSYPMKPQWRWMVAGTIPINYGLKIATGDFITHLDDDDEYTIDRITKLVKFIKETKADFIWHPFWREDVEGKWKLIPAKQFQKNEVTSSSVFYHNWFKKIPWDINSFMYREPGDWNRFRKIVYLGAEIKRYPEPLLKHYREKMQIQSEKK